MNSRLEIELAPEDLALLRLLASDDESVEATASRIMMGAAVSHLTNMDPGDFERLVGRALSARGYKVEHRGGRGDEGIDLLAARGGETIAIQCKRYDQGQITPKHVREFLGAITAAKVDRGVFVTTSTYTEAARDFALAQSIELVDRAGLPSWLSSATVRSSPHLSGEVARAGVRQCSSCGAEVQNLSEWVRAWVCATCKAFNSVR